MMADPEAPDRWPFLSPEWIAAVRAIRADYPDPSERAPLEVAANVTVSDVPFGDGEIHGHIDTTGTILMIEEGHLDTSDFGIEIPYDLAKALIVDRDPTQAMPALMGGEVRLTGDSSKVLMLATLIAPPSEDTEAQSTAQEIVRRIDAVTEP